MAGVKLPSMNQIVQGIVITVIALLVLKYTGLGAKIGV